MPTTDPTTDADLEALEQERVFLLRSLADLDAEYEAGDIDDDDYRSLTDDYTARTAAVLRAIEAATAPRKGPGGAARLLGASSRRAPGVGRVRRRPAGTAGTGGSAGAGGAGRAGGPSGSSVAAGPGGTSGALGAGGTSGPSGAGGAGGTSGALGAGDPRRTSGRRRRTLTGAGDDATTVEQSVLLRAALRSRRRWRGAVIVVLVIVFGGAAVWAVAQSSGSRLPGQTVTGNGQLTGTTVSGGVDPRLANAADLVNQGKVADALKLYDDVLKDDPNQPVALADGGWLEAQAGLSANRADLVDSGLAKIEQAEKVAPTFADAHFFRGFLLLRAKNDAPGAVTELRYYLGAVDPTAPQVPSVQSLLQEAIKAAGANVPAGPNAPTTTAPPGPTATASP